VTHLSLSWRARARTIKELLGFARRERTRSRSRAAVLIGDLNALPGEEAMRLLESDWTDAWVLAHGSPDGGGTWPWFMPFRRIDYVFLQPASAWHLRACEREPASGSDHLGVVARLRMASVVRAAEVRGGETP
jgi:endonuclease/exonuclease/phosphatase family metal-dependent hydrolase